MYKINLFLLIFLISVSNAQVNIEKFRKTEDLKGLSGNVEFNISSKTGNVDITDIELEGRADYYWENMNFFLIFRNGYGWESGEQYSNNGLLHLRHIFRLGKKIRPEIFTQVEYSKERLMNFRGLGGGGLRLSLLKTEKNRLWWGTAIMYEYEKLDASKVINHEIECSVLRWSNYISTSNVITDNLKLNLTAYLQPDLKKFKDFRLLTDTDLAVDLSKKFTIEITFRLRYDSEPPDNVEETDTVLLTGLSFSF